MENLERLISKQIDIYTAENFIKLYQFKRSVKQNIPAPVNSDLWNKAKVSLTMFESQLIEIDVLSDLKSLRKYLRRHYVICSLWWYRTSNHIISTEINHFIFFLLNVSCNRRDIDLQWLFKLVLIVASAPFL